jgi:hypothetical protein
VHVKLSSFLGWGGFSGRKNCEGSLGTIKRIINFGSTIAAIFLAPKNPPQVSVFEHNLSTTEHGF